MLFKEVIGQTDIKQKLIKDVDEGKVSHAHLFLGELGHGGLPLALAFSTYLLCENKQENDSCGKCNSCRYMKTMEHPDIHFTFPTAQAISRTSSALLPEWKELVLENPYCDLNSWIDKSDKKGRKPVISRHQSVEIIKSHALKSFAGGYNISILWMADTMNVTCANKLLKIIEEPPKGTVFILVAASEETMLPTILSRTQITRIRPLPTEVVFDAIQMKSSISSDIGKSIAARSEGNLYKAFQLVKSEQQESSNYSVFVELMRLCYKKDVLSMLDWADKMTKLGREQQKQFLIYSLYLIRQSLITNYVGKEVVQSSSEEVSFLSNFSQFITGNNVTDFNNLFNKAHYSIERNAYGKLVFTNITFEVMRYIRRA